MAIQSMFLRRNSAPVRPWLVCAYAPRVVASEYGVAYLLAPPSHEERDSRVCLKRKQKFGDSKWLWTAGNTGGDSVNEAHRDRIADEYT